MFLGVLAACAMLLLLTEILQRFRDISNNDCPLDKAALYFICFLPYRLVQILPLASIIAVLFSIGALAHSREMLAITASGMSPSRMAAPIIVAGALISVGTLLMAEFVVPRSETMALDLRRIYIEGRGEGGKGRIMAENVSARGIDNQYYRMRRFRSRAPQMMEFPGISRRDEKTGWQIPNLTATSASLISERTESGKTLWEFYEAREFLFNDAGRLREEVVYDEPLRLEMEANLHKYLSVKRQPEEMGALELAGYISMLEAHGEETGLYWTDFWLKLLFPLATLIFVTAGFAFALRAQVRSMVVGFAEGITFALAFYAVIAVTQAMGHGGVIPPLFSVILPMVVFAILAGWFLKRSAYTMT